MSIAQHIHLLKEHLARLGLQAVPATEGDQSEVFKVCFLNKYEMQQWKKLQTEKPETNHSPNVLSGKAK